MRAAAFLQLCAAFLHTSPVFCSCSCICFCSCSCFYLNAGNGEGHTEGWVASPESETDLSLPSMPYKGAGSTDALCGSAIDGPLGGRLPYRCPTGTHAHWHRATLRGTILVGSPAMPNGRSVIRSGPRDADAAWREPVSIRRRKHLGIARVVVFYEGNAKCSPTQSFHHGIAPRVHDVHDGFLSY